MDKIVMDLLGPVLCPSQVAVSKTSRSLVSCQIPYLQHRGCPAQTVGIEPAAISGPSGAVAACADHGEALRLAVATRILSVEI